MKSFIIIILCLFYTYLNSYEIKSYEIDASKKGIVLGMSDSSELAQKLSIKFNNYDIYIKKTTTTKVPYYVLYAVNISKNELSETLLKIQKISSTAYIASDSRIKQLSEKNEHQEIKPTYTKQNIIPIKQKNETEIIKNIPDNNQEIKQTFIKEKNETVEIKSILDNKQISYDEKDIDTTKKALSITFAKSKDEALKLAENLKYYDIYIRESISKVTNEYVIYMVNIDFNEFVSILNEIKLKYPNVLEASTIRIKYFKRNPVSTSIFIKAIDKPKVKSIIKKIPIMVENDIKNIVPSDNTDILYSKAKKLFESEKYQEAIDVLYALSQSSPSDTAINFYLGRAYYKLKEFEKASAAFERIIIVDDTHLRARLELAQTYLMLGLKEEAIRNFNIVLKSDIPDNVRNNIELTIKNFSKKQKMYLVNGFTSFGITYDNNINNTTDTKTFDTPYYSDLVVTDEKYSDTYYTILLNCNLYNKLDDKYMIENKINFIKQLFNKDIFRLNDDASTGINKENKKELDLINYSIMLSKTNDKDMLSYGFDLSKVKLANEDYLNTYGLIINYQKRYFSKINIFSSLRYFKKDYSLAENENLNSNNIQITLAQSYPTIKYGDISFVYLYINEDKIKDDPNSSSKDSHGFIFTQNYHISDSMIFSDSIYYSRTNDKSNDPTFELKKSDDMFILSAGFTYNISQNTTISSNIKYIKNNSNISIYNYDKETIDFTLKKSF